MPQSTPPSNHRHPSTGRPPVLPLLPDRGRPPGLRRPLPDAGRVRRLPVPVCAPPYDDELPVGGQPDRVRAARSTEGDTGAAHRGPSRLTPPDGAQDADGTWPGRFAQVLAETLAGSRPPRQLEPWTTEQARKKIRRLGPALTAGQRPLVRRVVTSRPAADVVEMTVVVRIGPRVRALAIRLERDGPRCASPGRRARAQRWLCTAIEAA